MKLHLQVALFSAGLGIAWPTAAITMADVERFQGSDSQFGSKDLLTAHLSGIGAALVLANAALELQQQKPLYCQPPKLPLNAGNLMQLLDSEAKKYRANLPKDRLANFESTPVEVVLLQVLKEMFPCP
jgi:hypothetical protein